MKGLVKLGIAIAVVSAGSFGTPNKAMACGPDDYLGTVCTFAANFCPDGWLPADGRSITVNSNPALYSLLSNYYGGSGVTTFNLPDLRGRVSVGTGASPFLGATINVGTQFGQKQITQLVPLPAHTHTATFVPQTSSVAIPATPSTLQVTSSIPVNTTQVGSSTPAAGQNYLGGVKVTAGVSQSTVVGPYSTQTPDATSTVAVSTQVSGSSGFPGTSVQAVTGGTVAVGGTGINGATMTTPTLPPSLGMTTCIMAEGGVYPPRP
ncbi:phage tail protein [Pokkaliibacter sp. CJK22405]|uniref:phage tail protein n=1 Tax=Pokkaliibacter sp. CJK22405 TaxID=3384615 RepID=UPI0039849516